jgi:Tol biopolymer transport system component
MCIRDRYEIETGSTKQLTTSGARDAEPAFSPDGEWIVFESNRNGNYDIWAIRPDGTGLMQITQDQSHEQIPIFSPDGRWIFFSSTQYGSYDIIRIPWGG